MNQRNPEKMKDISPVQTRVQSTGDLRIEVVRSFGDLDQHAEAWNSLARESLHPLPMLSHAWAATYLEHQLRDGESWFCLFAYDQSELVGVIPIVASPINLLGIRRMRLRTPHDDNHTRSVDFLCGPNREKEIVPLLLSAIERACPTAFCLELRRLPPSSPTLSIFSKGIRWVIGACDLEGYGSFIRVEGSYTDFRTTLNKKFNKNLRRLERKLATLQDVKVDFLVEESATAKELARFMQVEAASWKGKGGTAISQSPSLVSFYSVLARRLAEQRWLEWHFLSAEGKTIAGHYAIRMNRSLVVFKIGFDDGYAPYSPGTVLFERMIFDSGEIDEIDCLTDYDWNRNWQMEHRPYYSVSIFPRRFVPEIIGVLPLRARALARQVPGVYWLYRLVMRLIRLGRQ